MHKITATVSINGVNHDISVGKTDSLNKKIQGLVKRLGMRFVDVDIQILNFPELGRHLIKKRGAAQLNAIV